MSPLPADLDQLIHAPIRLRICTTLDAAASVEFATLKDILGVSDSVLSKHLTALREAGYVGATKRFERSRDRLWLHLTDAGEHAFGQHVAALMSILPPEISDRAS